MRIDQLPSHEDMVRNVKAAYDLASPSEVADGIKWYAEANGIAKSIAEKSGVELWQAIELISVASPGADWSLNVKIPALILEGKTDGLFITRQSMAKVKRILAGESAVNGPKTTSFAQNIAGNHEPVTIDGWMVRIACADPGIEWKNTSISGGAYKQIALAVKEVANELNILPAHLQAIVWVAYRNRYKGKARTIRKEREHLKVVNSDWGTS